MFAGVRFGVISRCGGGVAWRPGDCDLRSSSAFVTFNSCSRVRSSISCARWMTLSHLSENSRRDGERDTAVAAGRRVSEDVRTRVRRPVSTRLDT